MANFPVMKPVSRLSRDSFRKLAYHKIDILHGFCALAPRFAGRHGILTYHRAHESPHFLKDSCWPYFAAKS